MFTWQIVSLADRVTLLKRQSNSPMTDYHTYRVNVYEQAKILDRWVTPPRHAQVTSPTWDPLPPPEQALRV